MGVHLIEHSGNPLDDPSIPRGFRRTRHNRQKQVIVAFLSFNQVSPANCSLVLPYGSFLDYSFLTTCGMLGFFPYRSCSFAVCSSAHRVILAPFWGIILSFHLYSKFSIFPVFLLSDGLAYPNVLIAIHSFVKRLRSDLHWKFDHRAAVDFKLSETAKCFSLWHRWVDRPAISPGITPSIC